MISLKDINTATLDDTSSEDFEVLLNEYNSSRSESYKIASKKRFDELVLALQQDADRFRQI